MTSTVTSRTPAELPPLMMTASHSSRARFDTSSNTSSSSPTIPYLFGSQPASSMAADSAAEFTSLTCPGPGLSFTSTSSSPVEMTPMTGRANTSTSRMPRAARTPA